MSILRRRRETHAVFETGRIPLLLHLVWLEEGKKVKCWASYRFHPQHFNVCLRGWFKSVAECETHSISIPPNMCMQYCRLGYGNGAVNTGVENVIALPYNLSPKNPALPLFHPQLFCGACSKHLICLSFFVPSLQCKSEKEIVPATFKSYLSVHSPKCTIRRK